MDTALKERVVTGAALIFAVLLGVLILPRNMFAAVALIIFLAIGGWEWSKLVGCKGRSREFFVAALITTALIAFLIQDLHWVFIVAGVLWWVVALVLLGVYEKETYLYKDNPWLLRLAAFLVLVPAWISLVTLHQLLPSLVLYLIFLVTITDSGAYFAGKAFGKNKLAPELSPGKTREGVMGGVSGAFVWSLFGASFFGLVSSDFIFFILLSVFVAFISVSGDLFESLIKREADQKDSGDILPGHGGILDRVDGLIAALPIFTLGIFWGSLLT